MNAPERLGPSIYGGVMGDAAIGVADITWRGRETGETAGDGVIAKPHEGAAARGRFVSA